MYNNHMIVSEQTGIEILYRHGDITKAEFSDDVLKQYNNFCEELDLDELCKPVWSKDFNIPEYYKTLDIREYVTGLIPEGGDSDVSVKARVEQELAEFEARKLFPVLQLMIYIVNTMRKNKIVWGVGRGSSVASYVLYLLGVHKIDSIKYNLDIREFLK